MPTPKEKRTKEQVMRLLDRAIEQEEALLEKVKILESELSECRKKAENPRHELDEQAMSKSKISFRLDFYRTAENSPLKGIIEHLPSRESRSFEGNRFGEISDFITQFVGTTAVSTKPVVKKTLPAFPPEILENVVEEEKKERSPLLKKLFPDPPPPSPPSQKPAGAEPIPVPKQLEAEPFLVLTEGNVENQRSVRKGQPFQIEIPMLALGEFQGKPCSVRLSAKSLERKSAKPFEMVENHTPNQENLQIPADFLPWEQGVYRLQVTMSIRDEPQKGRYQEARLLIVQ